MKKYNVWNIQDNRWLWCMVHGVMQNPSNPFPLSRAEALAISIENNATRHWLHGYNWAEVRPLYFKPKIIIPDMPLDPSLPILMAGHLQDRQRKKYRL